MAQRGGKQRSVRRPPMPMHKEAGRKELVNCLSWLLDFLNQNIRSLPTGLFLKLNHECLEFLYKDQARVEIKDICKDTELDRKAAERIQALMKLHLDTILDMSRWSIKQGKPYFCDTVEASYEMVVEGDRLSLKPQKKLMPYETPADLDWEYRERNLNVEVTATEEYINDKFQDIDTDNYVFFSKCFDADVENNIILTLVPLLERFPLDCIRVCPYCDKYYKSTRKKRSPLCSPCLKRMHTYKWRKDNREAWNEYQRNLAKGVKDETPAQIRERQLKAKKKRRKKNEK